MTSFALHNPYLWQVKDREFQLVSQVTRDSLELKATLEDWLTQTSPRDIQTLVQLAFDLLLDAEIVTTTSLFDNSFLSKSKEIIRNFCRLTKTEKTCSGDSAASSSAYVSAIFIEESLIDGDLFSAAKHFH